ncbi:MAG: tetratricopeptide repeat protein [Geobacteraceae bacterium]|nr:tetratricopeptide repeat protein [Geobacteraceae bacterium]
MKQENMVFIIVALLVGLLGGFLIFSITNKNKGPSAPQSVPMGSGSPTDYTQRITEAEKIVAQDPKNYQVWVQLANDYFDTEQPQKAVNAYGKALEIDSKHQNTPNVLTDQGVMYRKMGLFDKAVANFEKASSIDPKHAQSLFNLGVVYANDLKQNDKAISAWTRYLAIDGMSPQGQQVKAMVDELKAGGGPPKSGGWK